MALIKARPLSEFREDDQDFAGRATRRARRRYRKARRETRDQEKARELRQKARGLEQGSKKGKKRKKKGGAAPEPAAPEHGPRRFPGGLPGRGPMGRRRDQGDEPEALEPEVLEPEEELDPEEVFPEEGDEELGRAYRARAFGPLVPLGLHLRVQAEAGHRAAIIALRPGLFLVAEIPEETTRTQIGLAPVLAPLLLRSASKALLQRRPSDPPASPEAATPGTALVKPGAQAVPAANLGWADAEDVAAALGCDLCDPRDRRARR